MLWVAPKSYQGPITISGRQIGGPNRVRFSVPNGALLDRLEFAARSSFATSRGARNWRQFPTYIRRRASGCYMLKVTGSTFSQRIVLRATTVPP